MSVLEINVLTGEATQRPYTEDELAAIAAIPLPTHSQLVAQTLNTARAERQPIISVLDGLQASALAKGDSATALTIETVKQGLRDITKTELSSCITAEEMSAAIKSAYAALVQANPSVAAAFKGVIA